MQGESPNTLAVGAQVEIRTNGRRWYAEQMLQRRFQSSVDPVLHVGLGAKVSVVDTVMIYWPDGRMTLRRDVPANQKVVVRQNQASAADAASMESTRGASEPLLVDATVESGILWSHEESAYNDFQQSRLLLHMRSTEGPPLCVGDINGDRHDDLYIGGARDQAGAVFLQAAGGRFKRVSQPVLEADRASEDISCELFDATGDGILDLYVGSGSSEFPPGSPRLADRLYRISSNGTLMCLDDALPEQPDSSPPTGAVRAADFDADGDVDLVVGTRMGRPYGTPVGGQVLANDGTGYFADVTSAVAPGLTAENLQSAGIRDAVWGDLNGDAAPDLTVVGEWMPLSIFYNRKGRLVPADLDSTGLEETSGWWQSVVVADMNGDGQNDIVGGNHGLNSRFEASANRPV